MIVHPLSSHWGFNINLHISTPWLSILPRDVDTPLMWLPDELEHLKGSNLVGFRITVLGGWSDQHRALFPSLTEDFPTLFPEVRSGGASSTLA